MLHACFLSNVYMFPSYFHTFTFVFRMFSYTNILTRCPRPIVVFCMFLVSEFHLREIFSEWAENPRRSVFTWNKDRDRKRPEGGPGVHQRGTRRRLPKAAPGGPLAALATASRHLFAYKLPLTLKSLGTELFFMKTTERCRPLESPI